MKKILLLILAVVLCLSLVACGEKDDTYQGPISRPVVDKNYKEPIHISQPGVAEENISGEEVSGEEVSGEEVSGEVASGEIEE